MAEKNVRIRLFKDNSRYKGDLFVSVNGVNYKIRRGVEVEVPPAVAEVPALPLRRTRRSKICNINVARLGEMPPAGLFIKRM